MRLVWVLALAAAACGAPRRAATTLPDEPLTLPLSPEDYPAGSCGGFASLGESGPIPLLAGRLRVRGPTGVANTPRGHSIMAAPPAAEMESRLLLEHEGARFVVLAEEILRAPTDDLVAAARAEVGVGHDVAALDVEGPLRAAIAVPAELDLADDAVDVAIVYTATEDDLVQRVAFYVTPDAARTGGCQRLGMRLARTLTAGTRRLPDEPGPRVLEGTLGIDLLPGHRLLVEPGPDFSVYRVSPVLPLGSGEGYLGIYVGGHPSLQPREGATRVPGRLLGRAIEWEESSEAGLRRRQALASLSGNGHVHVFFGADDPAVFDRLREVAESLREGVQLPPLAACPDAAPLPAVEAQAAVLAIPALQKLLRAETFSAYRSTWDVPRVASAEAFAELAQHPRAPEAFLYLAVHGTTAGRVYGLAGLYLYDRPRFAEVVCAVAGVLEPTVTVQRACATETVDSARLIENPDAVRGQRHWTPENWGSALARSPADVRGGGLAWELLLGPRDANAIVESGWVIGGTGYDPPLARADQSAASMPPLAPSTDHAMRMSMTQNGGVCRTRADGRVACWGSTPTSEQRGASLLPESVRWPAALGVDLGLGCVLDANGQRACFGLLEPALAQRSQACPGAQAPRAPVLRRFADGPWRALGVGQHVCGIRPDGSLRCFVSSNRYLPEWAELDGVGTGSSYPVAIRGEVRGVAPGDLFRAFAWTADGTIWEWDNEQRPHTAGRVEGVVDVTAGNDRDWAFARSADGRVFVRGAPRQSDGTVEYWSSFPREDGAWQEVQALRGARVTLGPHHGCALFPDGRVQCWGQHSGYLPEVEDQYDAPPADVPALRGARSLLVGEWLTCAEMRGGSYRCVGAHLDGITNGAVPEARREAIDLRPDRIAAAIR
jgi:hypothetical protein